MIVVAWDVYGEPVTERRHRARGCDHEVPCLTFECQAAGHRGIRRTPWCKGRSPDDIDISGDWCDECWGAAAKEHGDG